MPVPAPRFSGRPLRAVLVCVLASGVLSSACGYRFAGRTTLPEGIRSVGFAAFANHTPETGREKELQWAFEREFHTRGGIRVSEAGRGIVSATLRLLESRPASRDRRSQALEHELVLELDVRLTERGSDKVLWQANGIRVTEYYSAVPQVLVTTSPEFLQGRLDAGDIAGFTDIQFSETQRRLARERLFAAAAREVVLRLGDDF